MPLIEKSALEHNKTTHRRDILKYCVGG